MNALILVGRYFVTSLRRQWQYPGSSVVGMLGSFSTSIVELAAIWALFDRFGAIRGWHLGEIAFFFGFVSISFALADFCSRGFDVFGSEFLRTGEFDRVLLRPRTAVIQLVGHDFRLKGLGRLTQGAIVLAVGTVTLHFHWSGYAIALSVWTIAGAAALFFGLMVLQATLSFWTIESLEIVNVVTYGGVQAAQFPLDFYARWLRLFLIFVVPIACVAYFPVLAILGLSDPLGAPRWFLPLSPAVGFVFLAATIAIWQAGVRRYTSTGT